MKYLIRTLLVILAIGALLGSCKKEEMPEPDCTTVTVYDTVWVDAADTIPRHYNPDVANILNNYCITCHGGSAPSAGLLLTTYSTAKSTAESGKLIQRMNDGANPMPPSGLLPQKQRDIVQKWIDDGLKENP